MTFDDTDPELRDYFDNWAFGEVVADSGLDTRTRLIVQLAATIAAGGLGQFRSLAAGALDDGVSPVELKEIAYQAVPYAGMARAFDFIAATNDVLTAAGVDLPLPGQSTTTSATRQERGLAVQKQIVGADRVDAMYADAPDDLQHIQRYLSANCFGDTVARDGFDVAERELLTFAMLTALGGADAQVRSHIAANIRVGNDRARLLAVLTALIPFVGYPRSLNALTALNDLTL